MIYYTILNFEFQNVELLDCIHRFKILIFFITGLKNENL